MTPKQAYKELDKAFNKICRISKQREKWMSDRSDKWWESDASERFIVHSRSIQVMEDDIHSVLVTMQTFIDTHY